MALITGPIRVSRMSLSGIRPVFWVEILVRVTSLVESFAHDSDHQCPGEIPLPQIGQELVNCGETTSIHTRLSISTFPTPPEET